MSQTTTPRKRVLIINRWDDEFSQYHRYIDHSAFQVSYITTESGKLQLDAQLADRIVVVEDIVDFPSVLDAAKPLFAQGPFDSVIALCEFDLITAARLRLEFGVDGPTPEIVMGWRDKAVMKERIRSAAISVPRFARMEDKVGLATFLDQARFPIIIKPLDGAASRDTVKVETRESFDRLTAAMDGRGFECEEFIAGDICHADGIVENGQILFIKSSKYVNSCLDFRNGKPVGSYFISDAGLQTRIKAFMDSVLKALSIQSSAFHCEFFHTPADELVFLEIGARVSGADVPFVIRDLYGVDLVGAWLDTLLGQNRLPAWDADDAASLSGGSVMFPEPALLPSRVKHVSSLQQQIPGVYKEHLPPAGKLFTGQGGYEDLPGRFLIRGPDADAVKATILQVMANFRADFEPALDLTEGAQNP